MIHNFETCYWGHNIEADFIISTPRVEPGDYIIVRDRQVHKILDTKPCLDPKDMTQVLSNISIGKLEDGDSITKAFLDYNYKLVKDKHTIWKGLSDEPI